MIPIICIEGATASGKSDLAIRLAKELSSEIISADSRQVYKYLDIGTAKPDKETLSEIKHHLIDIINPNENYNAGLFIKDAEKIINELFNKGKIPIVCGGTMLYIDALLNGISFIPDIPDLAKKQTIEYMKINTLTECYKFVYHIDYDFAKQISPSDKQRISRALDVWFAFNKPITKYWEEFKPKSICKAFRILINRDRNELYQRINQRMSDMVAKKGLLEEIYSVLQLGYNKDDFGLKAIGYKEFMHLFINNDFIAFPLDIDKYRSGDFQSPLWQSEIAATFNVKWKCYNMDNDKSLIEAINKAAQHTRNYAKRQITWYKKKQYDLIINDEHFDILSFIKNKKIFSL